MKPLISIIIPTLNEERVIEKTLQSLRTFSAYPHEVIVSDGKSTDQTVLFAKRYADHVIVREEGMPKTIAAGRNLGATKASGEYFVFIDADVQIPDSNNFFTRAVSLFETDKKLCGLNGFLKVFPDVATFADNFFFQLFNYSFFLLNNILRIGSSSGEFQMVRAEVFKKIGGYNETLAASEDNELFLRLARQGRTRTEPALQVFHTSRRAHAIGWPKLLLLWWANGLSVMLLGRSWSSVWKVIR